MRQFLAEQFASALLHFAGRFVCKRHGQNTFGANAVANEMGYTERNDACFAGARSGQHEQGARAGVDRFALRWIEIVSHPCRLAREAGM